ncbi:MAG: lipoate protein ligase C-terminal domain-containing protein [Spirochaetota bacterium]
MSIHVVLKNPGEKLVHIDVDFYKNTISFIHISGDFFIYPEEAIDNIEQALLGLPVDFQLIEQNIVTLIQNNNIEMVGISAATIAQGIQEAFTKS